MMKNSSKQHDHENLRNKINNNKLTIKSLINFISTGYTLTYRGSCNKAFFFSKQDELYLKIVIIQQFSLNKQTKILKQWDTNYFNFTFINKTNQFFASDESVCSLWKIDSAYNQKIICKNVFSYVEEENWFFHQNLYPQYSFLVLSANNDLIVTSIQLKIHFIIKQNNGIWNVQQIENFNQFSLINGYTLNEQGNVLIVSIDTSPQSQSNARKLLIYLKIENKWKRIEEIDFPNPNTYCFVDNDKFAYLQKNYEGQKLIIWKVFSETLEVKIVQKHELLISRFLIHLSFMQERKLFVALSCGDIYFIKQVNNKFQLLETVKISEHFELENTITEEFLIFKDLQTRIKVVKLYGL